MSCRYHAVICAIYLCYHFNSLLFIYVECGITNCAECEGTPPKCRQCEEGYVLTASGGACGKSLKRSF